MSKQAKRQLAGSGEALPAGVAGEVIETVITSSTALSSTLGTYTDVSSIVLPTGVWEIEAKLQGYADVAGSGGVQFRIAVTDSGNTIVRAADSNYIPVGFSYTSTLTKVRVNTAGTYKLRACFVQTRPTPTITNMQTTSSATVVDYIRAVRIA